MDQLFSAGPVTQLSGMIAMYLVYSAFHSPPWLKLIASRRNGGAARDPARVRTFQPIDPLERHKQR
jgi:hypothetical protein